MGLLNHVRGKNEVIFWGEGNTPTKTASLTGALLSDELCKLELNEKGNILKTKVQYATPLDNLAVKKLIEDRCFAYL